MTTPFMLYKNVTLGIDPQNYLARNAPQGQFTVIYKECSQQIFKKRIIVCENRVYFYNNTLKASSKNSL